MASTLSRIPYDRCVQGTETMAEQEQRFIKLAEEVLGMLTACESFRALEEKFKNKGVF